MAHVVGQMIQAEAVHQLQVVQTVGHGKRLVGRHARPVHEFGTVERQQADQRDAVAQVGQFAHLGEIRNVLTLSNNNNTSTTVSNFLFWNISWNICLMISTKNIFQFKLICICRGRGLTLIRQNSSFPLQFNVVTLSGRQSIPKQIFFFGASKFTMNME